MHLPVRAAALVVGSLLAFASPVAAAVFTVTTTADTNDGACTPAHCTLREAILAANARPDDLGGDEIRFAISGSGVRTIVLSSQLPAVSGALTVDGYTQAGSAVNTNPSGAINAVPLVEVRGMGAATIFRHAGGFGAGLTLRGLVLNDAVTLVDAPSAYLAVTGCFLGTNASGTSGLPGSPQVTAIRGGGGNSDFDNAIIGGPGFGSVIAANRNVIAGNGSPQSVGIEIAESGLVFSNFVVAGNLIGLAKDGTTVLGHGLAAIAARGSVNSTPMFLFITGNSIAGATASPTSAGVLLARRVSANVNRNTISRNSTGVRVESNARAFIGASAAEANRITENTGSGVVVGTGPTTTAAATIRFNDISNNGGVGIDLDDDGPTEADALDADVERQNAPVITRITQLTGVALVQGQVSGPANTSVIVDVYVTRRNDARHRAEGAELVGTVTVTTTASGVETFTFPIPRTLTSNDGVAATATTTSTSEFSRPRADLALAVRADPTVAPTFQEVSYLVTVTSPADAPANAIGTVTTLVFPPDTRITASACGAVSGLSATVVVNVPRGANITCAVRVRYPTTGIKSVAASLVSPPELLDPNLVNNAVTTLFNVNIDTRITLAGRVTRTAGTPTTPATITLAGASALTTTTDALGAYSFPNVSAGSYTVTASAPDQAFAPPTYTLLDVITSQSALDFVASVAATLRVRVRDAAGQAVPAASVTLQRDGSVSSTTVPTGTDGIAVFPGLAQGTYVVTPGGVGRAFEPASRTVVNLTTSQTVDFTARGTLTLSGTVTDPNGTPLPGVTIGLSGGRTETTTTDASGAYAFTGLPSTNVTVTPSRTGFTFTPIPRSVTLLENTEDVSFVAQSGVYTRYLAEGSTGDLFDTQIALFNATGTPAATTLTFQLPDGTTRTQTLTIPGPGRRTVTPETVAGLEKAAFSTVVESDQPLAVDRTMTWDSRRYGSHAETGIVAPLTRWFLAEGATTAGFQLFYLVQNPNATSATVQVRYLLTVGAPLTKSYVVQPNSRATIWVNLEDARLAAAEVSADLTSDLPIIVERAMYRDVGGQLYGMGHAGAGVPQQATQWFFAEGATGPFFDLFFLIANPTTTAAQVEATYLRPNGSTVVKTYTVPPNSRFNIWVDLEDPALANTAVGTTFRVTNGVAVVVERAMWWAGEVSQWVEGHNTAGATLTGEAWALAEGEVSGAPYFTDTFILIANTGTTAGTVRVTLVFEDGTPSVSKELPIPSSARLNVSVRDDFPEAVGKRFGVTVESVGAIRLPLVVERAMYNRSSGVDFAAGTAALGARLR